MSFEFYDDIAFFWFFLTLLSVILVPYSFYMMSYLREKPPDAESEMSTSIGRKKWQTKQDMHNKEMKSRYRSWRTIVFVSLWVFFLYGVFQVGSYKHEEMVVFDPYKILEVETGATEQEIKKAYRKLSRVYHPDKNPGDEEAAQKFMMLAKAEQTLTDEVTRKNWEEYGNPDGYQGTSVTIGLPSAMLKKENEMSILVIYFFLICVLPPICVGMWWKKNWNVHETGVLLESIHKYVTFIQENTATKFFVEILCTAGEFGPHMVDKNMFSVNMQKDCKKAFDNIVEDLPHGGKPRTKVNYAMLGTVLLYSHLLRDVHGLCQDSKDYLNLILSKCHKLMAVMLDITQSRHRKIEPIRNLMSLSQHVVQAVYFGESDLYQMPHLGPDEVSELKRSRKGRERVVKCEELRALSADQRRDLIRGLTEKQWLDIDSVCDQLPDLTMEAKFAVEDEKGLFEGDLVKLTVNLSRTTDGEKREQAEEAAELAEMAAAEEEGEEGEGQVTLLGEDEESDDEELFEKQVERRAYLKKKKAVAALPVHAPLFPEQKHERWLVILTAPNGWVYDMKKVPTLREEQELEFLIQARKGKNEFQLHALCDSYIGCDRSVDLSMMVKAKPPPKEVERVVLKDDDDDDDEEGIALDDEEEEMPLWMTILDLTATFLLLSFIGFGMYLYLSQKPWWIANIKPRVDAVTEFMSPVTSVLAPWFAPLQRFFDEHIAPRIYVEDHVPVYIDPSRANHWQRAGIGAT